ncbi:23S rRNA accumulation protein YceD [Candidatus Fukatsuia anoeciicola]|uniref:23S rRNA accumulation protein YceD n=1 Tax=Candidatus Fukatsuia anoeciicola TaxID=2994492 RepID=UPI003464E390
MQKLKLPLTIDALSSAQRCLDYSGIYLAKQVMRVAASVVNVNSDVKVWLSVNFDDQCLVVITGNVDVDITLMCQRCGNNFSYHIHTTYCFSPVTNNQEAETLPEVYEPVNINKFGKIDLLAIIEDEIILSVPMIPLHKSEYCAVETNMVCGQLPKETEKPNLFRTLVNLKKQLRSKANGRTKK